MRTFVSIAALEIGSVGAFQPCRCGVKPLRQGVLHVLEPRNDGPNDNSSGHSTEVAVDSKLNILISLTRNELEQKLAVLRRPRFRTPIEAREDSNPKDQR